MFPTASDWRICLLGWRVTYCNLDQFSSDKWDDWSVLLVFLGCHLHPGTILRCQWAFVHKEFVSVEHENIEQHDCDTNNFADNDWDMKHRTHRLRLLKQKHLDFFNCKDQKGNLGECTRSSLSYMVFSISTTGKPALSFMLLGSQRQGVQNAQWNPNQPLLTNTRILTTTDEISVGKVDNLNENQSFVTVFYSS
jgi:hypothetical protein